MSFLLNTKYKYYIIFVCHVGTLLSRGIRSEKETWGGLITKCYLNLDVSE